MSSTRQEAKNEDVNATLAQLKKTSALINKDDFVGEKFKWERPNAEYSQAPNLPICIGPGMTPPFSSISYPIYESERRSIGLNTFDFIDKNLKAAKAAYVVAITKPKYWDHAAYLDKDGWDSPDSHGFLKKFKESKDIKYLSFSDESGKIMTLIAKRKADLFHLQAFKNDELYHEMHVLNLNAFDGHAVRLYDSSENTQILHDMLCEALEKNKNIYNHCAAGIGRSAVVTLAELIMIQLSPDLQKYAPKELPDLNEPKYFAKLLSWAQNNIRTGLLGAGLGLSLEVNFNQVLDCVKTGAYLLKTHQKTENRKTIAERVLLSEQEAREVLALVGVNRDAKKEAVEQKEANASLINQSLFSRTAPSSNTDVKDNVECVADKPKFGGSTGD